MLEEKYNRELVWVVVVGLFFTILGMATTSPALNTGDYDRTLMTMALSVGGWSVPDVCIPYNTADIEAPTSTLAIFGNLFSQLDRALGHDCLHHERWYIALSLIYWLGVFFAVRLPAGARPATKLVLFSLVFFLFSGFFYSFYQEAMLFALTPWLFAILQARQPALLPFLLVLALAMYVKTQMLLFVPVLMLWIIQAHDRAPSRLRTVLATAVVVAVGWLALHADTFNTEQNAFNRIFNGIGWSLLEAETWPEHEFDARHSYFYDHEAALTRQAGHACAPAHLDIMGTAFWPTADDLAHMVRDTPTAREDADFVQHLGLGDFLACLQGGAVSPLRYLHTIYAIYLGSDYAVPYAIPYDRSGAVAEAANALRAALLRHLPYLGGLAALVAIALSRSRAVALAAGYILIVTPVLVVMADGYFEFEKHMTMSFVMLLGPVLADARFYRRPPERAFPTASSEHLPEVPVAGRLSSAWSRAQARAQSKAGRAGRGKVGRAGT